MRGLVTARPRVDPPRVTDASTAPRRPEPPLGVDGGSGCPRPDALAPPALLPRLLAVNVVGLPLLSLPCESFVAEEGASVGTWGAGAPTSDQKN